MHPTGFDLFKSAVLVDACSWISYHSWMYVCLYVLKPQGTAHRCACWPSLPLSLLITNLFHDITLLIAVLKEADVFCAPGGLGMIKMMIFTLGSSPGLSKDSNSAQAALIGFRQLDYLSDFNYHNLPAGLNRYNGSQMLYWELPWHQRLSCFFFFFFFYQRINIWKTALIMQRYTLWLQDLYWQAAEFPRAEIRHYTFWCYKKK